MHHLAAAVGVKLIVESPVRTIETNVHGTEVVLKHAAQKKKLDKAMRDLKREQKKLRALERAAERELARVTRIVRDEDGFTVTAEGRDYRARTVLMATGVINNRPAGMDDALHTGALAAGLLRYCPICDGRCELELTHVPVAATPR